MDNKKNAELIQKLFAKVAPAELYASWANTFDVEVGDEDQVSVIYHGTADIKNFKRECKELISSCIVLIMGKEQRITILPQSGYRQPDSPLRKKIRAAKFFTIGMIFLCVALVIVLVLGNYIGNRHFRETFYLTSSIKVDSRVRVVQLSDLHGATYGENNKELLERVAALEPDIILCTGDIVDSTRDDQNYAVELAKGLVAIAPSYYIYGNNEVESVYGFEFTELELDTRYGFDKTNRDPSVLLETEDAFADALEAVGMKVLKNETDTITVRTMTVDIYGSLTSNPSAFWSYSGEAFRNYLETNPDHLKITAVHEPVLFQEFDSVYWGDLLVSGHTHGGVIRVPILGPLYTLEGGLFPHRAGDFVYGRYDASGCPLIVSGGMENSNILRINNPPELVVIDINKF